MRNILLKPTSLKCFERVNQGIIMQLRLCYAVTLQHCLFCGCFTISVSISERKYSFKQSTGSHTISAGSFESFLLLRSSSVVLYLATGYEFEVYAFVFIVNSTSQIVLCFASLIYSSSFHYLYWSCLTIFQCFNLWLFLSLPLSPERYGVDI